MTAQDRYTTDYALSALRETSMAPPAIKARLSARRWLLTHGWTVEQINAAKEAPND